MERKRDYQAGLFDEFEKLNKKLDELLKENKEQSLTIYNLNLEIEKLNKTIHEKDEKIEKLIEEIDRLKNKTNKNSNNSSKPSSTNITTPKKKTGANLYNYRIKTNKRVGGSTDTKWPFLMYDLIFRMNNTTKLAMEYGLTGFSKEMLDEYNKEYGEILELAKEENKNIKSSYYKAKKVKPFYNRLVKYKKNHLYFIEDFNVPFDDNLSEQDLRTFKNKTKISGGFRSMETAQNFANALSIIKTSIKRNINPFDSIKAIFENRVLFN